MTPQRWQEIDKIYQAVLDLDPSARVAFLDQACAGDAELRREVVSLLEVHAIDDPFLESPALEVTARALADEMPRMTCGQRVGSYELIAPIGSGGMGEVWRALDPALKRQVAIKFLLPQYSRDPDRLRRFEQEARAAGMLNHPNILTIYAIGKEGDSPFLVTELLEGVTLRQRLADGAVPETKAIEYAIQIAQGLSAAHNKGIVHRDLKPENIFVINDGRMKILDFGLAKLVQLELGTKEQTETAPGMLLGTPAYMSPEQVRAERADHRSDIFALGAVLYEMLAGRRPFVGDTSVETMNAILKQDPPPIEHVSPVVQQIVSHCLEKEPAARFQSAGDLAFQLNVYQHPSAQTIVPPSNTARRRYFATAMIGLVVTGAIAGLTWQLMRSTTPKRAPVLTRLTFDSGLTTDPAISADGKLIAYASDRGAEGNLDIWRQQLATGEAVRLTSDPQDESEPVFSPDDSQIAFRSERDGGGIYLVSAFGGEPRLIASQGRRPRFSPDGTQIAYWIGNWRSGRAFVAPTAAGTPTPVQPDFASVLYPIWSPDGKYLLFLGARAAQDMARDTFDWWVVPRNGGPAVKTEAFSTFRQQKLADGRPSLVAPATWIGDDVFFSATREDITNLWRISVAPPRWKVDGLPQQLTFGTSLEAKPGVISGGRIVFASLSRNLNIWSLPIEAGTGRVTGIETKLTHGSSDAQTSLSADGKKLVFISARSGNPDVWMKDLATGKESGLTATPTKEDQAEITRDGKRICYWVNDSLKRGIYSMKIDGGVPEILCEGCARAWDWSPDGRTILHLLEEGRGNRPGSRMGLGLLDLATRQISEYIEHPQYHLARARFSPDGRWISLLAISGPAVNRVMVIPFQTDPVLKEDQWISITQATTLHDKPQWSPDGNLLYFTSDSDGFRCIRAQRLNSTTKRPIGEPIDVYHSHSARRSLMNAGIPLLEISLSPDRLVFNLGEVTGNVWMAKLEGQN